MINKHVKDADTLMVYDYERFWYWTTTSKIACYEQSDTPVFNISIDFG